MSFPASDGTEESNEFLCLNCFDFDRNKSVTNIAFYEKGVVVLNKGYSKKIA